MCMDREQENFAYGGDPHAYKLTVLDWHLYPSIQPGYLLEVHPSLPLRRTTKDLVVLHHEDGKRWRVVHLHDWTDNEWVCAQYTPMKLFTLARSEWPIADVVFMVSYRYPHKVSAEAERLFKRRERRWHSRFAEAWDAELWERLK